MKTNRWDRASNPNTAQNTPWLPVPTAYDIKLEIDHIKLIAYCGPLEAKNPQPQVPYEYCNIRWKTPTNDVMNFNFISRISNQFSSKGMKSIQIDYYAPGTWGLKPPAKPLMTTVFNFMVGAAMPATGQLLMMQARQVLAYPIIPSDEIEPIPVP